MKQITKLTNLELQVMNILWSSDVELTVSEISELTSEKKLSIASVNQVIPRLIEKNFIEIKSFKTASKKYARAFAPLISQAEYTSRELVSYFGRDSYIDTFSGLKALMDTLAENLENEQDRKCLFESLKSYAEEQLEEI